MAPGLRKVSIFLFSMARIRSGISRSSAQSPPPMTLPARAEAIAQVSL